MNPIRVLMADHHTLFRAGIRTILEDVADIKIVAEACDGFEALALVEAHRPDVALVDITTPGLGGLDVAARVAREYPGTKVIILTMHKDGEYVRRAVEVGVAGYLLKDSDAKELERALRAVASGGTYLSPGVSQRLLADARKQEERASARATTLTKRQLEVLMLIVEGKTTKTIARTLKISVKTVESHRALLMQRLGIFDVAGLVRYAIRVGLITTEK